MKRNILLFFALVVLSVLLAIPFANLFVYNFVFNYYGSWFVTDNVAHFANGFPFVYILLSPLIFGLWGLGRKWLWVGISLLPILYILYYIESDTSTWFWSSIFFVSGAVLSVIVRYITNLPMVINK